MEPTIYLFFKGNRLEALMTMKKITSLLWKPRWYKKTEGGAKWLISTAS